MELVHKLALGGGLFSLFVMTHFIVDWIFQTHSEAMVKHNNAPIRAKHCAIYTLGFIPWFFILNFSLLESVIAINVLFWSHFIEDTYYPVYLWAKYIRKPPEMNVSVYKKNYNGNAEITAVSPVMDDQKGFLLFVQTPLGKILMIAVDQIIHLIFLLPLVWMALN